jgi:hypothetical protein
VLYDIDNQEFMQKIILLLITLFSWGCGLNTKTKTFSSYPALPKTESFRVFHAQDTFTINTPDIIGEITMKDGSLALMCDYDLVVQEAIDQAKIMGGNILRIYEHKKPDFMSTCHRIKAKVLRVKEAWRYENEIMWHKDRKLKIRDFKGDTLKKEKNVVATTSSGLKLAYRGQMTKRKTIIEGIAYFDCRQSFFTFDGDSLFTLEHEQLHFDITELYARKLIQRLDNEFNSFNELSKNANAIFEKLHFELGLAQKEYDREVLLSDRNQQKWKEQVAKQLVALKQYESKQIEKPFFRKKNKN